MAKDRMPPPGTGPGKGVAIIISPGGKDGPGGRMPPPGMDSPGGSPSGKVSPDEAKVVREDEHCVDCRNYSPDSGECEKVEGSFSPDDGCHMFFLKDDESAEGEPSSGGSDDQGPQESQA